MRKLPNQAATASILCLCFFLLTGPFQSKAVAATAGMAAGKDDALKTVEDLRSRLERNARAEPMKRLSQTMRSVTSARELNGYGMTLFLNSMPVNALIVLTESVRRSPGDFLAFNNLGAILNNLGQYDMARTLLRYADELSPDNAMVLSNLGVTELGRRREKEAEGLFLRAVAKAPKHPEANYALGALCARRGDTRAAEQYFNSSLEGAFTRKAARALGSLERESRRAARKQGSTARDRSPAQPPPVPAQAAKEDRGLRLVLPEIEADSLPEFVGAEKAYNSAADRAQSVGATFALELKELANPLNQSSEGAPAQPGRTVIPLLDGKAMRGLDNASPWHDGLQNLNGNYLEYIKNLVKKLTGISAEQDRIRRNELTKCNQLPVRARDACRKAVDGRACGRYFEAFEPPFAEFKEMYEGFSPTWQTTATGYVQTTDYWASYLPDPLEAKGRRLNARLDVSRQFLGIATNLSVMSHGFGPPLSACFEMPKPPPPTGELRIEDFVVPCEFPGIDLSFDGASLSIDCTKVTIGGEVGPVVGELEWDFVQKTGTLFLGVGAEVEAGKLISVGASARLGMVLSFDREGFTDIGLKADADMGASWDLPGRSIDIVKAGGAGQVGLNSAPSVERTLPSF